MATRASPALVHAPGAPTFELHTLGWRAFQDLCAAVLREVWGQSVQPFADSRDGGRDGAFYGTWANTTPTIELPDGPFVLQCKFLARRDQTLTLSAVEDELAKVKVLVDRGLCTSYMLMSNARVTGNSEAALRKALADQGVAHPIVLGGSWLNQTIALNQRLRMFVPRVYGLGDLSQILDERAYTQARALLNYLQEDLSTFVVTDAYRRAVQAIEAHGFCLLLGEPAVGKSVIAATLAMTALDRWQSLTVRADGPADIVTHWAPHEPNQFFWVDDAFGSVRHEPALTYDWARRLPKVMAAVKGGAKMVLTCRDYIYRDARPLLKEYAFPLLHEQQIVIDVAELSQQERQQILYNHIRLGDQPGKVRTALKPHLSDTAEQTPFRPEVARRLGRQVFTKGLALSRASVRDFMARPNKFLQEVYEGLEPDHIGALAMVYQAGELRVPLEGPTKDHEDLLTLMGSTYSRVARALMVLEGTFLRRSPVPGRSDSQEYWSFRHPTLREGFATFIVRDPNLLELFIKGLDDEAALVQLDCGSGEVKGTLVAVPPSLYGIVAKRVLSMRRRQAGDWWRRRHLLTNFLATRCSRRFLEQYLELDNGLIERCVRLGSYLSVEPELDLLAKLHQCGLLPDAQRIEAREEISRLAIETPDSDWLGNRSIAVFISDEERSAILTRVRDELLPDLDGMVSNWRWNEQGESAEEYYGPLESALKDYADAFSDDPSAVRMLQVALEEVDRLRAQAAHWHRDDQEDDALPDPESSWPKKSSMTDPAQVAADDQFGRDVFDDVDQ